MTEAYKAKITNKRDLDIYLRKFELFSVGSNTASPDTISIRKSYVNFISIQNIRFSGYKYIQVFSNSEKRQICFKFSEKRVYPSYKMTRVSGRPVCKCSCVGFLNFLKKDDNFKNVLMGDHSYKEIDDNIYMIDFNTSKKC